MKKSIIAIAVAAATLSATSVSAATVYEEGANKVTIGGRLAVKAVHTESVGDTDSSTEMENASSRITFGFEHEMAPGWTAGAKAEWGYDALASGDQEFGNRLGNIYFKNDAVGAITVGKQWSAYYDVVSYTDVLWINGGSASGAYDGQYGSGDAGTGRADDAITYRNSMGGLSVGLQYQFGDNEKYEGIEYKRHQGYQASLNYDFDFGLSMGAAFGSNSYKSEDNAQVMAFAAKYSSDALYLAAQYGQYENHRKFDGKLKDAAKEATGYELIAMYKMNGGEYQVYGGYNSIEDDNSSAELSYGVIGAAWVPGKVIFATEYKMGVTEKNTAGKDTGADQIAILARYNF